MTPLGLTFLSSHERKKPDFLGTTRLSILTTGLTFDFRGESIRSAEDRGGTLSDSNQRSGKGFRYTLALTKIYGGLVGEYKLDWFFVKGFATDSQKPGGKYQFAPHYAWTLKELDYAPNHSLSDHAPLTVDLPLTEPPMRTSGH